MECAAQAAYDTIYGIRYTVYAYTVYAYTVYAYTVYGISVYIIPNVYGIPCYPYTMVCGILLSRKLPEGRFGAFRCLAHKVGPRNFQNYESRKLSEGCPAHKVSPGSSSRLFWSTLVPSPQSGARNPPELGFGAFQGRACKVDPGSIQKAVLDNFRPKPQSAPRKSPRALCCCTGSMFCCTGAIFCSTGALFCCMGTIFLHIHLTWTGFVGWCGALACNISPRGM